MASTASWKPPTQPPRGFDVDIVHISSLTDGTTSIQDYHFLNFPGGFLDGDDLGAAKAQAVKWRYQKVPGRETPFVEELIRFVATARS